MQTAVEGAAAAAEGEHRFGSEAETNLRPGHQGHVFGRFARQLRGKDLFSFSLLNL